MLVPGVLAGMAWLTGPVFGAIAVMAFWRFVRATEGSASIALGAVALLALAPFMVFMAGSHMNHVPTLAWMCLAFVGVARRHLQNRRGRHDRAGDRLLSRHDGRDPAAGWRGVCAARGHLAAGENDARTHFPRLPARVRRRRRASSDRSVAYNVATTGSATLFGHDLLWGASHGLGFHRAPWGVSHTPARGLELVNLYFLRLQNYLFETPLPSLVPAMTALALARRLTAFDRYLLASSALLVTGCFAYWHDGFFLGPRFFYLLLPALVLWTARVPAIVRDRKDTLPPRTPKNREGNHPWCVVLGGQFFSPGAI
jgi:hypothetical protein